MCKKLGLKPAYLSSQVVQRDRHAQFFSTMAILGGTLEKIAVEIRHLQRTEVGELCEGFSKGQKGSSAMPHKKNPIGSENITGIARLLRANAMAAFENIALWHERDISHSSVERVIAPDSTILADYALSRMTRIIENIIVDEEKMASNINLTKGLCFSGKVLIDLVAADLTREEAYKIVQQCAMKTFENGKHLKDTLLENEDLLNKLGEEKIKAITQNSFELDYYFKNISFIFDRSLK